MRIFYTLVLSILSITLFGQLESYSKDVELSISNYEVELLILPHKNTVEVVLVKDMNSQKNKAFIKEVKAFYEDGDIVFRFNSFQKKEEWIDVNLTITQFFQKINPKEEHIRKKIDSTAPNELRWMNVLEEFRGLNGKITCKLDFKLLGAIPSGIVCGTPPIFGLQEKLPYYSGGLVGLTAIGIGQIYRIQKNKKYDEYLAENSLDIAEPLYKEANSKNQTYFILTVGGIATIAIDGLLYGLRKKKHKKKLNTYHKYCSDKTISIRPIIEVGSLATNLGIQFNF